MNRRIFLYSVERAFVIKRNSSKYVTLCEVVVLEEYQNIFLYFFIKFYIKTFLSVSRCYPKYSTRCNRMRRKIDATCFANFRTKILAGFPTGPKTTSARLSGRINLSSCRTTRKSFLKCQHPFEQLDDHLRAHHSRESSHNFLNAF